MQRMVLCSCDCGNHVEVRAGALEGGHTKSCGCHKLNVLIARSTKHGEAHHPLYRVYSNIKTRCTNINSPSYKNYGGRGISIEEPWKSDYRSFFDWAVSSGWRKGLEIDRIDVNGNYCPSNCRLVTVKQQSRNKRNTIWITIFGERLSVIEAYEKYTCPVALSTVRWRVQRGWDIYEAFTTPKINLRLAVKVIPLTPELRSSLKLVRR
jgi:hypothetical protein